MHRFAAIYEIASRNTENTALRAFFIASYIAESDIERDALQTRFWREVGEMPVAEQAEIRKAMQQSLRNLVPMADDLLRRVRETSDPIAVAA